MLAITVKLGLWQLDRLAWKTALLADIARSEILAPVPLTGAPKPYQRVFIDGQFLSLGALYGVEVREVTTGPAMGAEVVGALLREGSVPLIVDRGWAPVDRPLDPPPGPQHIEGYVRPPDVASWMSARDDPERRRFFTLDPVGIGKSLGLPNVAPFTIVALGKATNSPQPATSLPRPSNDHLSYAATWFSLSVALVVIFCVFVRQTLRRETLPRETLPRETLPRETLPRETLPRETLPRETGA